MEDGITFVGLDVHVEAIRIAIAKPGSAAVDAGEVRNRAAAVIRRIRALVPDGPVVACYEAGPIGYGLHRSLEKAGITCHVIAPSLIPIVAGDRVKTDRRDAIKLATFLRGGHLIPITVPTADQEALRNLCRGREMAVGDLRRARQRLDAFLRLHSLPGPGGAHTTQRWWRWVVDIVLPITADDLALSDLRDMVAVQSARLERLTTVLMTEIAESAPGPLWHALQHLHGVGPITAAAIIAEVGDLRRFATAPQFMAYAGLVPSEHSSGASQYRGRITRTGNNHIRYLAVECGWHQTYPPKPLPADADPPPAPQTEVERIARHARTRLYRRYARLHGRGKCKQEAVVAVARELLGYIWAIGTLPDLTMPPTTSA